MRALSALTAQTVMTVFLPLLGRRVEVLARGLITLEGETRAGLAVEPEIRVQVARVKPGKASRVETTATLPARVEAVQVKPVQTLAQYPGARRAVTGLHRRLRVHLSPERVAEEAAAGTIQEEPEEPGVEEPVGEQTPTGQMARQIRVAEVEEPEALVLLAIRLVETEGLGLLFSACRV